MEPLKFRIFVCTADKEEGKSCCVRRGSKEVLQALKDELIKRGLHFDMKAMMCGCLDRCETGPSAVVYPAGLWYEGLKVEDVPAFVQTQLVEGKPYAPKLSDEKEVMEFFEKRKARKKAEALRS